jgi:hypothetical protein
MFLAVLGVTRWKDDPSAEGNRPSPEAGEERALELFELSYAGSGLGFGLRDGGTTSRIFCGVLR